jgi:hypothetical protein
MLATTSSLIIAGMTVKSGTSFTVIGSIFQAKLSIWAIRFLKLASVIAFSQFGKIFNVGFPKAGTCSIQYSLQSAGIDSVHWALNVRNREYLHHVNRYKASLVCVGSLIQWAKKENLPLLHYMPDFEAFTQMDTSSSEELCYWPQLVDVPTLDKQYPNSKFIFNTRPLDKWISSINRWYNMRGKLISLDIPGLPRGVGGLDKDLINWHNWQQKNMVDYFGGENEKFIIFDIEKDNPQKLANFVGIKNMVWEKKNVNTKRPEKS